MDTAKWEYLTAYRFKGRTGWEWNPSIDYQDRDEGEYLNYLGSLGWELVSVTPNYIWEVSDEVKSPGVIYLFKRIAS